MKRKIKQRTLTILQDLKKKKKLKQARDIEIKEHNDADASEARENHKGATSTCGLHYVCATYYFQFPLCTNSPTRSWLSGVRNLVENTCLGIPGSNK